MLKSKDSYRVNKNKTFKTNKNPHSNYQYRKDVDIYRLKGNKGNRDIDWQLASGRNPRTEGRSLS